MDITGVKTALRWGTPGWTEAGVYPGGVGLTVGVCGLNAQHLGALSCKPMYTFVCFWLYVGPLGTLKHLLDVATEGRLKVQG